MKTRVCIVIPAYNESQVIGDVVNGIKMVLKNSTFNAEIVVVNDASKDATASVAKASGATVISHILNSGAGGATATGLRYAHMHDFELAATMDADGQHLPQDVLNGLQYALSHKTDLLIGSRLIDSSGMSGLKKIGNKGLSVITFLLFGINVTDSQSGLRVFSKRALGNIYWKTSGYEFCSEMLWRAKQKRLIVDEYPITAVYTEYSMSKGQNNWNGVHIVSELMKRRFTELFG